MKTPEDIERLTLLFLVSIFVLSYGAALYRSKLRGLPGPFLATVTGLYRLSMFWRGTGISHVLKLHQKYGLVVRTGSRHVLVADPDALFVIYGTTFPKSNFYDVFQLYHSGGPKHTVITTQDNALHRLQRVNMASKFSAKAVLSFEPALDDCIDIFTRAMERRCGEILDLEVWLQYLTGDIAAETGLGKRVGFMEKNADVRDMIQGLKVGFRYATSIGQVPACHSWLVGNRGLISFMEKFMEVPNPPGGYIDMIEKALDGEGDISNANENTILSWLQTEQAKRHISRTELINSLFVFVAGGSTVAVTLGAIFYYLIKTPSAYGSLREEIEKHNMAGRLSSIPTHEQTLEMPYLELVVKEAMRLCPVTALPLERIVPDGGVTIGEHYIPAGTKIGTATPAIHMNSDIYGSDAVEFKPERWIEADTAQAKRMDKYFFGWSKGSRSCLGKNFAMLQMRKIVVQVLRKFDVEWASDKPEWELKYFWVTEQHGLMVRFRPRGPMKDLS